VDVQLICNTDYGNQLDRVVLNINNKNTVLFVKLRWHKKIQRWLMSIFDEDNSPVIRNIPLVPSYDFPAANLLNQFEYLQIGEASVFPTVVNPTTAMPVFENLGAKKEWGLVWRLQHE